MALITLLSTPWHASTSQDRQHQLRARSMVCITSLRTHILMLCLGVWNSNTPEKQNTPRVLLNCSRRLREWPTANLPQTRSTPKQKLSVTNGEPAADATFYRSITVALQYLTLMRPDIAYAVNQACLYMHSPRAAHFSITIATDLHAYSDADWAGCRDTRRSTSRYCVYLGDSLISWSSKW
jgi:hypothetical protein